MISVVKPKIIYETSYPTIQQLDFMNSYALREFLSDVNMARSHIASPFDATMPVFRLGTQIECEIDGVRCMSDIVYGPSFMFARSVIVEKDGRLVADILTDDAFVSPDGRVYNHYNQRRINPHVVSAIIEPGTLKQLWPLCKETRRSVLNRFLGKTARTYTINH